jgi:hypothetical protein
MRSVVLGLAMLVALPGVSYAQNPDFLFTSPRGAVALRTGWLFSRADSDLFTFVQDQLTIERKDFNAPAIGIDVDLAVAPRASAVIGFDFSKSSKNSAYRDLVDNNRLPITQTTSLSEMNLSGSIKYALTPPGRRVSTHAFIPAAAVPYVGAGGGFLFHRFFQEGDFVDFQDSSVFPDTFTSTGWSPSAHLFGGIDVKVWRKVYFNAEARYLWSKGTLDRDFADFDPIDLAGFKLTGGVRFMF